MAEAVTVPPFARSIERNSANRDVLLRMNPLTFIRQMAYWEACFTTSGDRVTAGCRLTDEEWSSITVPTVVTGGNDPVHRTICAQRIHGLIANCEYHEPVIEFEEWSKLFGHVHYPVVSDLQGKRIAPVWRDFIKRTESKARPAAQ